MSNPSFNNPNRIDPKQAYALWSRGFCDADIADRLEVSKNCVGEWRRRNCLKANRANVTIPVEARGQISQEAWEARQAGMRLSMPLMLSSSNILRTCSACCRGPYRTGGHQRQVWFCQIHSALRHSGSLCGVRTDYQPQRLAVQLCG